MHYMRTKMATDFEAKESFGTKIIRMLLFFIPEGNPGYREKLHLVNEWFVEFDEENMPYREIGLNSNGTPVLAGPDKKNYGYWLDTNMTLKDFEGEEISKAEFEKLWELYFSSEANKNYAF